MYEQFFGLSRPPFRLEPEAGVYFAGKTHSQVFTCVANALKSQCAIVTLHGRAGTGKTTLVRCAIEELVSPETVIIQINRTNTDNLINAISDSLNTRLATTSKLDLAASLKYAAETKKQLIIHVEDADDVTEEEIHSLLQLARDHLGLSSYFKFILTSQKDLSSRLGSSDKGAKFPLCQHCQLEPLAQSELVDYVKYRLKLTGWRNKPSFDDTIFTGVFKLTEGVPRRINSFFDRFLLFLCIESKIVAEMTSFNQFCLELREDLESDSLPDLDSESFSAALKNEIKSFEPTSKEAPTAVKSVELPAPQQKQQSVAVNDVPTPKREPTPPKISLVKTKPQVDKQKTETPKAVPKPRPKRVLTPEQEKQGQLILMVSKNLENPESLKHYSDELQKLPNDMGALLALATDKDINIEKALPNQLLNIAPVEVRRMIRHFLKRVLFTSHADPFRVLGLPSSANEKQINQHFDYLMRICRTDVGGPAEWNKTDENTIKQAYIKILGSNNSVAKPPVVLTAVPNKQATIESSDKTPSSQPVQSSTASAASKKTIQTPVTEEIPVVTDAAPRKKSTKKTIADQQSRTATQAEKIPAINNSPSSAANTENNPLIKPAQPETKPFKLEKVQTKSVPWIPIALVFCIIGSVVVTVLLSGEGFNITTPTDQPIQQASVGSPGVAELELLNKNIATDSSAKITNDTETRVSKILAESEKKEAEPEKTSKAATPVVDKPKPVVNKREPEPAPKPKAPIVTAKPAPSTTASEKSKTPSTTPATQQKPATTPEPKRVVKEPKPDKPVPEKATPVAPKTPASEKNQATQVALASKPDVVTAPPKVEPTVSSAGNKSATPTDNVNQLTDADLSRLIFYFKRSYESGDINIFGDLFAKDAITNESSNRDDIIRDYDALFEVTDSRNIELKNLTWDKSGESASGNGSFVLSIVEKAGMAPEEIRGEINIKAEKIDQKAQIKELYYRYNFAAN